MPAGTGSGEAVRRKPALRGVGGVVEAQVHRGVIVLQVSTDRGGKKGPQGARGRQRAQG